MGFREIPVCQHASLRCSIRGVQSASTTRFRGLKYAHVPARYKESVLHEALIPGPDGVVDATAFGPSCPHLRGAQAWDLTLVGNVDLPCAVVEREQESMDEFECLNMNITVPDDVSMKTSDVPATLLPVFVWVHGGGLSIGSNSWPQYEIAKFVERSIQIGKPVIGVAINYRHGVFGFLANDEIGAAGNMGFQDQALAFRWIKKHIAGFGGNPDNVTAVGESAGAISLSTLLCVDFEKEALFERVVLMSGETTLRKPRNQKWQQQLYEEQSSHLKLDLTDTLARREALLDSDAEELAQKLPLSQHFTATIDGNWLKNNITLETLRDNRTTQHKPPWCRELVVGDAAHDGTILQARILDHPQALTHLLEACHANLTPTSTSTLLSTYGLHRLQPPAEQASQLRELVSELRFYLPALTVHRGWKADMPSRPSASRYHFHIPNPFPGAFQGLASHELDVAYLLQNFNEQMDEANRRLAQGMADRFIRFANGEGWAEEGMVVVFGREGVVEVEEGTYDGLYRKGRGAVLEEMGAQRLWHLVEMWQGVRKDEVGESAGQVK